MTDVVSADQRASADDISGRTWITGVILAVALLVATALTIDMGMDETFGWDARVNCAAVDAHIGGLDPYFTKNLKDTKLSYPYLPVTLDAFRPLCAGGFLVTHYKPIYLVLAVICVLLLPGIGKARTGFRDVALRSLFTLGGFLGFEWIIATGNFAILSGVLMAASLALLLRPARSASVVPQFVGAALLGLVTSFKLVFFPILAALYFLPQARRRKLALIAVAAGMFALPILASLLFFPELFGSWLSAILGQIPGQHAPTSEVNPSLLFLSRTLLDRVGLADSKPLSFALYGLIASALVLLPLAMSVVRMVGARRRSGNVSPLRALDDWLTQHPDVAMRLTVLTMYALYICAPRLKEYAFFEVALYAAILIANLPAAALTGVLAVAVAVPTLASVLGIAFMGGFGQLTIALICFWLLLSHELAGHEALHPMPQES